MRSVDLLHLRKHKGDIANGAKGGQEAHCHCKRPGGGLHYLYLQATLQQSPRNGFSHATPGQRIQVPQSPIIKQASWTGSEFAPPLPPKSLSGTRSWEIHISHVRQTVTSPTKQSPILMVSIKGEPSSTKTSTLLSRRRSPLRVSFLFPPIFSAPTWSRRSHPGTPLVLPLLTTLRFAGLVPLWTRLS